MQRLVLRAIIQEFHHAMLQVRVDWQDTHVSLSKLRRQMPHATRPFGVRGAVTRPR